MSKELKLSDVREYMGRDLTFEQTQRLCLLAKDNKRPLSILIEDGDIWLAAILQNAPDECVQVRGEVDWCEPLAVPGGRSNRLTYRLHRDVTLVDDTAQEPGDPVDSGEYGFRAVYEERGLWQYDDTGAGMEEWLVAWAANRRDYVCLKAEDAEGRIVYIGAWLGPYGYRRGFRTIESLIKRDWADCFDIVQPLTPKAVVFRKEKK